MAEHTPDPVSPLFATSSVRLANQATAGMWERLIGKDGTKLMAAGGFYTPINGFVFGGVRLKGNVVRMVKMSASQAGPMMRGSVPRWQAARRRFADVVDASLKKPVAELASAALLDEAVAVFFAACQYFTDIQTVLPAASMSEIAPDPVLRRPREAQTGSGHCGVPAGFRDLYVARREGAVRPCRLAGA